MARPIAVLATCLLSVLASPALAHATHGYGGGFLTGFLHPVLGWDHVAAMVAVGLWGAVLGPPAIWILPVVFPLAMSIAAALGVLGLPLPFVETGIAASAFALGLMILLGARVPLWASMTLVALFALFHGHAHGTALPHAANPFAYALGFVLSTGLLHAAGILFGLCIAAPWGRAAIRGGGALISLAGLGFLVGAL